MFNKMKKTNSRSYDQISMQTIDKLKESILPLILKMINNINVKKTFPDIFKISRIFPIRKSMQESPLDPSNWRPVNILSPFSKIVEKLWTKQIIDYLKLNKLIDNNHQG